MKRAAADRLLPALACLVKPRPASRHDGAGIGQQLTFQGSEAVQRRPRCGVTAPHATTLRYVCFTYRYR